MNFDHVADIRIRSVLNGDASEDALPYALDMTIEHAEDALRYALDMTIEHAEADQADQDVPFSVSEERLALALDASEWWDAGNTYMAIQCLKYVWR